MKAVSKIYIIINWVAIGWVCYFLLLPIISNSCSKLLPAKFYNSELKKKSPFCGVTRDFQKIYLGNFNHSNYINKHSAKLFSFIIFEFFWRLLVLILYLKNIYLIKIDTILHLFLFLVGIFIVFNL